MDNPYTSAAPLPASHAETQAIDLATASKLSQIAKPVFLGWEKLRLAYIGILGAFTLLLTGANIADLQTLTLVLEGAVVANVCYFAGPTVETYVRWLGYRGTWLRWILFVVGTMFTAFLEFVALSNILLPTPN